MGNEDYPTAGTAVPAFGGVEKEKVKEEANEKAIGKETGKETNNSGYTDRTDGSLISTREEGGLSSWPPVVVRSPGGTGIMSPGGVMDLPDAVPSPIGAQGLPGAYAAGPSRPFDEVEEGWPMDDFADTGDAPAPGADNDENLVVANRVEDLDAQDLPQAEPEGNNGNAASKQRQNDQLKQTLIAASCCIPVIVVIVLLLVLLSKNSSSSNDANNTPSPATASPTSAVSQEPTTIDQYMLSLLPNETVAAIETDPASPQGRAFQWLQEEGETTSNIHYLSHQRIKQRFALATLYFATNGADWTNSTNWLDHGVHECEWYNQPYFALKPIISRYYPGYLDGFFNSTTANGQPKPCHDVTDLYEHLWLDQNNLVGTLPEEVYLLTSLETLSTGLNVELQGTISSKVGQLTSLQGLALFSQRNAGIIPSEIGLLSHLRALYLGGNNHQGVIPSEFWKLTSLEYILMGRNPQLQGTLPSELGSFASLKWFITSTCNISGTIPSEMGKLKALEQFYISTNSLSGSLPSELGQLSKLSVVSLFSNFLEGRLPTQLGLLTSLILLTIRDNELSGPLPTEIGLLTNLADYLNLENNAALSGTIPSELGRLTMLQELTLFNNELSGEIPSQFGQLTSMVHMNLANNSLSGTVPQELTPLSQSLHTFNLEGNPLLSGIVPNALCNISGTCEESALDWVCEGPFGLTMDCTGLLCGCDCPC
ncbi:Leucine Rich Repeat [Seminavis robusta]|uniref:Leucine Rich Repeat n=1 Tax=Seminavis robusta TaxID=568900 RepID=A0A9N8E2E9_9STRA|nr:Leucine Rich Repeat [Seminavis robusta]|eukprot:Sro460_g147480.1 Leucine Rich Repeat (710) ;mRNA; r:24977-27217